MRSLIVAGALCITLAPAASAQKWKAIGKTSSGNVVSVDERSIKRKTPCPPAYAWSSRSL
jgi:hypothetical protein